MNIWKVILATTVIFAAGVVTGGLLVHKAERVRSPQRQTASRVQGPAAGFRLELLRRMERELDLTPDQRQRIDKILEESQDRSRALMEPVTPQLREEVKRAKAEFREVLTPGQQATFDTLLKQQQRPRETRRPHDRRND